MREHPIYNAFQRRWQLPVYFQLRWKEIVGSLEDNIVNPGVQKGGAIPEDFVTPQAAAFYNAIQSCWGSGVFIPELSHRFWRLTLQVCWIAFAEEYVLTPFPLAVESLQVVVGLKPSPSGAASA